MCSLSRDYLSFKRSILVAFWAVVVCVPLTRAVEKPLRVVSDPNNLPFSNNQLEGFENKIVNLIASDLGRKVDYAWRAQRRGFFREAFKEDNCDIIMGAPAHFDACLTTKPYYRSTYVFISLADRGLNIHSLDDPRLAKWKVGVQVGLEGAMPPAQALGRRGIVQNLVGYSLFGDYTKPNPPADIVDAVARRDIDVAIAWGPMAGYFAKRKEPTLIVAPIAEQRDGPLRMAFDICIGVKRSEPELRDAIDRILLARQMQIDRILEEYGVPKVSAEPTQTEATKQ